MLEDYFTSEDWRLADKAADFLEVDRDLCRRAFHREPAHRVHEVVRWVFSERELAGYDPERMIEGWAREHRAGVYGDRRRGGDLERADEIAIHAIGGLITRDEVA